MYTDLDIDGIKIELNHIKSLIKFSRHLTQLKDKDQLEIVVAEPSQDGHNLPQNQNPMEALMRSMQGGEQQEEELIAALSIDTHEISDLYDMMIEFCTRLAKDKERRIKASITGRENEPSVLQMDLENTIEEIFKTESESSESSSVQLKAQFKIITPSGPITGDYSTNGVKSTIQAPGDVFRGDSMNSFWHNMGELRGNSQESFISGLSKHDLMQDISYLFQQKGVKVSPTDIVNITLEEKQ